MKDFVTFACGFWLGTALTLGLAIIFMSYQQPLYIPLELPDLPQYKLQQEEEHYDFRSMA